MKKLIFIATLVMFCGLAANADVIQNGNGVVTGSWTQQFIWTGTTINSMTLVLSNSTFEHPLNSFSNNWVSTAFTPTEVSAAGGSSVNFYFNTDFVTNMSQPLSFEWFGYYNGNDIDQGIATWDGANWTFQAETPTPEPASLALLGSGFLGIGGFLRKKLLA